MKFPAVTLGVLGLFAGCVFAADVPRQPSLAEIYSVLASKRFVDLTHAFGPTTPHWKGFGEMKVHTLYTIENSSTFVRRHAHRLVQEMARRRGHAESRQSRRRSLSGLEPACIEASL